LKLPKRGIIISVRKQNKLTFLTARVGVCNREKTKNESSKGGRIERPIAFMCILVPKQGNRGSGSPVFETLFWLAFGS
jgi:hypothetical protein